MIHFIGLLLLILDICPALSSKDEFWTRKDLQTRQHSSPDIADKISRFSPTNQNIDDPYQSVQFTQDEKEEIFLRFAAAGNPEKELSDRVNKRELIEKIQEEFELPITGKIDEDVIKLALSPRCGVTRAFISHWGKWTQKHITYSIFNYSPDLTKCQIRNALKRGFRVWEEATDLTFKEVSVNDKPDIKIGFRYGFHADGTVQNTTFAENVLAHAFYPGSGSLKGVVHFNEAHQWTTDGVPVVKTYHGNSNGAPCVFPFKIGREHFNECIPHENDGLDWCSTTNNFDKDKKWGYCPHPKLYTFDGNSAGQPCVFPFKYGNKLYTECTNDSGPENSYPGFSWCATTSDFNRDKKWGYCPTRAIGDVMERSTNMVYVTVHEIGHTLGFNHSLKEDSIMYPYIRTIPKLSYEDVRDVQHEYGKRYYQLPKIVEEKCGGKIDTSETPVPTTRPPTTTTIRTTTTTTTRKTTTTKDPNFICNIKSFDAALSSIYENFFFKGSMLWKVFKGQNFAHAEVYKISEWFKAGPKRVDAAYMTGDYKFVLFSGKKYWRFSGKTLIEGPKPVTDLGLSNRAIRAVVPMSSEKVLFYYRRYRVEYNPNTKKKMSIWSWMKPRYSSPDAALGADIVQHDGYDTERMYFFKKRMVYKVNKETLDIEDEMDLKTYFRC